MEKLNVLDNEAQQIVAKYDEKRASVLPLLHLAQEKAGFVTNEAVEWVSRWSGVPAVHVREVVTFYSMYREKPAGRHHIRYCTGTSCVLREGEKYLDYIKNKLGIENGGVTGDGRFSLEESECLCNCENAPMMQVDKDYHTDLTEKKIDGILDNLK